MNLVVQFPKVMESSRLEKSIGGIGAISNRSEDDVFSDTATEFQDSGFGLGRQDSLDKASKADKIAEKDLTPTISFKDCEDTGKVYMRLDNKLMSVILSVDTCVSGRCPDY